MFLKVFLVGGAICTIAQLLINYTKITAGKILVYFLLAGAVLQSVGVYQYIVDFAGAGATVPISGFGYLLAKGAIEGAKINANAPANNNLKIFFIIHLTIKI